MAIQQLPIAPLGHEAYHIAEHRIRRCTYRRLIAIDAGSEQIYEVECLFPDRQVSIPLGDLDSATPICNFCSAAHIFRPDED
jgi:thiamine pyrophosphokinase